MANFYATLTETTPPFPLGIGYDAQIVDAPGGQTLMVAEGAALVLQNSDGPNTIELAGSVTDYLISNPGTGGKIVLTHIDTDMTVSLDARIVAQTIVFPEGELKLLIDLGLGEIVLGEQIVTGADSALITALDADDVPVEPEEIQEVSIDGLGTLQQRATLQAGDAPYRFIDDAVSPNFVDIVAFGADDEIVLQNAADLNVVVTPGADTRLSINADGTVSSIALLGVASGIEVFDLMGFNALDVGNAILA